MPWEATIRYRVRQIDLINLDAIELEFDGEDEAIQKALELNQSHITGVLIATLVIDLEEARVLFSQCSMSATYLQQQLDLTKRIKETRNQHWIHCGPNSLRKS